MSPFQKKLLIHGSVFFILLVIFIGTLVYLGRKIETAATEIEAIRKQLYDWIVSLESFASIRTEYSTKAERYITVLNNRLPQKEALIDLRKDFKSLAASEGVVADVLFSNEISNTPGHVGAIGLNITMNGKDENVINFLHRLNELRYLITIDSVSFSKNQDGISSIDARGKVFFKG